MISSAGAVDAQSAYDPFGRRTTLAGRSTAHDGFVNYSRYLDGDVSFARFRAYSADLGRWMSRDPIGTGDGPNVYAYVANNATSRIDLLGLAGIVRHDEAYQAMRNRIRDEIACAQTVGATVRASVGPVDDKNLHCQVACYMVASCGEITTELASYYKEIEDVFTDGEEDWKDLLADWRGWYCGKLFKKYRRGSCRDACNNFY